MFVILAVNILICLAGVIISKGHLCFPDKAHEEKISPLKQMEAKVVEAQAEVPHAMAQALRDGKLGVMDYYNLNNVQADTDMRNAISHTDGKGKLQAPAAPVK